jgi:phosphoglycolate phosphatase-like HAD superfamily hydrolase
MTLTKKSEGIYIDDADIDILHDIDAIIFDCDGVLIDITRSYDLAIIKTTRYILENFAKITDSINVNFKIIDGFKSTGGFNDEVDLAYAAILSLVAAKKLQKDPIKFIFEMIKNSDSSGIISVEKYLENQTDVSEIKKQLSYPGTHNGNPLYQIFDQLFYGPELYQKLFKNKSKFSEPGLIEQDDVILNDSLLELLYKKFNSKIAMVTGRGKKSVSYSLKELLMKFDLNNSVFLEDESRGLAKPNPQPLFDSIKGLMAILLYTLEILWRISSWQKE